MVPIGLDTRASLGISRPRLGFKVVNGITTLNGIKRLIDSLSCSLSPY